MVGLVAPAAWRSGAAAEAYGALVWFAGLLVLIGLGIAIVATVRRRFRRESPDTDGGFTIDQLRKLRNRGELTVEEYDALKRRAVGMLSATGEKPSGRQDS